MLLSPYVHNTAKAGSNLTVGSSLKVGNMVMADSSPKVVAVEVGRRTVVERMALNRVDTQ